MCLWTFCLSPLNFKAFIKCLHLAGFVRAENTISVTKTYKKISSWEDRYDLMNRCIKRPLEQGQYGTIPALMFCLSSHILGEDQTVPVSTWALLCLPVAFVPRSFNVRFDTCCANRKTRVLGYQLGIGGGAHSCTAVFDLCQVNQ